MKTAASSSLFSVSHPLAQYHSPNLEGHLSFLDPVEQTPTPFSLVDHSVSEEWDVTDSMVQLSELSLSTHSSRCSLAQQAETTAGCL